MLKINQTTLIAGDEIIISWEIPKKHKNLYIYLPENFWFWKNYTKIPATGHLKLRLTSPKFYVKLCKYSNFSFKTLDEIKSNVIKLKINRITDDIILDKINSLRLKNKKLEINNLKIQTQLKKVDLKVLKYSSKNLNTK